MRTRLGAPSSSATCSTTSAWRRPTRRPTDLMHAVAQLAREQLSQRWVASAGARPRRQGAPGVLPVDGVPDRPHAGQRAGRARPAAARPPQRCAQHAAALEDVADARARRRAGQRRPGPAGGLLPRLDGHAGPAVLRLRHPLRVRHVRAGASRTAARSSTPTPGWPTARRGSSRAPACSYPVRFGGWVEHRERPARRSGATPARSTPRPTTWWCPATAPSRSARCGCGRPSAPAHIDLHAFNTGDYARAAEVKNEFENISWVLYPNDSTPAGRELRLRQEYFFAAASMQDILAPPPARARHARPTWPTRWRST